MNKSEKFWDRLSNKFDKRAKHFDETTAKTIEHTKKYLNDSDIVLDYGCATGRITYELAADVKQIHGLDISSKMIEAAEKNSGEYKADNIDFAKGTIFDERYDKESFHVILAFNILHLVEDTQKVVQRINEILKPGGLIISVTPCLGEKRTLLSFLLFLLLFVLTTMRIVPGMKFLKIFELEVFLTGRAFEITETETLSDSPLEYFIVAKKV